MFTGVALHTVNLWHIVPECDAECSHACSGERKSLSGAAFPLPDSISQRLFRTCTRHTWFGIPVLNKVVPAKQDNIYLDAVKEEDRPTNRRSSFRWCLDGENSKAFSLTAGVSHLQMRGTRDILVY
jgi:hypothetical protein